MAGILLVVLLERRFPHQRQPFLRDGFWTDLVGYTIVQGFVLGILVSGLVRWLDAATGASRLGLVSDWPVAGQVAAFTLLHDFYIYWFHRAQHASPLLWRLHQAHHSETALDALASTRSHALEILVNQSVEFAVPVLLGAAPEAILARTVIGVTWGLWIHANVDVRSGWLQWVVNGPEAHRWHHAMDADARGRNFATKLALWDRLFGTAYLPPAGRRPSGYGLGHPFPHDFLGQQAQLFRRA